MADYTLTAKLMADAKDFIAGFDKAQQAIQGTGEQMKNTGKNIAATGAKMSLAVTTPLVAAGKSIITLGMTFDDSMSQVAAVSGATGDDLDRLRDTAKEMGATTRFSASEAADALNYMAMAGWKTDQMISGLPGILSLAAASGEDLATTSDIVTDALTAFGLTAADSGSFADVLAAASSNANTNVVMLGESFKYVAPLAGAMGYSAEDVSHALGLMANAGIKGSQAGTSLKTMLANLASPTKQMQEAMDDLGISLKNNDGTMKTLDQVMGDLRGSFSELDETQQAAYASTLFGKEAMAGSLSIINASEADYNKLSEAINNSEGAAAKMAETMEANIGGMWRNIQSATEGVAISLYERMNPAIMAAGGVILGLLDKLNNMSDGTMDMILIVAAIAAALGPALIALGTFGFLLSGIATGVGMLLSPVGLIILGLVALGAIFTTLWLTSETFRETIINVFNAVKTVVMQVVGAVVAFVGEKLALLSAFWTENGSQILQAAQNVFNGILSAIQFVMPAVLFIVDYVWSSIKGIISGALDAIMGAVKIFSGLFTGDFSKMWEGVKQLFSGAIQFVWNLMNITFVGAIRKAIVNLAKTGITLIRGMWDDVVLRFMYGKDAAMAIVNNLGTSIIRGFNGVKNGATRVWEAISKAMTTPINKAKDTIMDIVQKIKDAFNLMQIKIPMPKLPNISVSMKTGVMGIPYPSFSVSQLARGTDYWEGGFARMNEGGRGELVSLPEGTQVIPHDVSMRYAREAGRSNAMQAAAVMQEPQSNQYQGATFVFRSELNGRVIAEETVEDFDQLMGYRSENNSFMKGLR